MTDIEFLDLAENALKRIEAACDRINSTTDTDIDNQRTGNMVTLTFANKSQIIVNLQKPLHEIWLAAKRGGFHFQNRNGQWLDTKGQGELFEMLSDFASEQSLNQLDFIA